MKTTNLTHDNNSESDYFIFLHQNQNIFSEKIGNQNIFQKKTVPYGWHLISPFLIFEYNMKKLLFYILILIYYSDIRRCTRYNIMWKEWLN
jgi:hypothetical protein